MTNQSRRWLLGVTTYLLLATPSGAPLVTVTYEEYVSRLTKLLDKVGASQKLDAETFRTVKKAAATWIHIGPCEGQGDLVHDGAGMISIMFNIDPTRPFDAALLQLSAIFTIDTLGRKPNDFACRYALEIAHK